MSKTPTKPAAIAIALAGGIALAGSAFAMQPMAQGYLLSADEAAKAGEGKCGEGKCGLAKADTDKDGKISQAEFAAAHPEQAAKFADIDTNQDGFIDADEHKAHSDAKGGEGKCGEGKCGEGKCGGSI
ncbi:HvfA family oxazolone/thioamide-modified RiPP metallophore [Pseudoxanthomonas putridarboris]|uniref:EF-hand domain-containing protein n=1 Tax=Pseudoxanthomonas putridarboris TaxID=752605 RepID=A0ABU9IY58_9GAMM